MESKSFSRKQVRSVSPLNEEKPKQRSMSSTQSRRKPSQNPAAVVNLQQILQQAANRHKSPSLQIQSIESKKIEDDSQMNEKDQKENEQNDNILLSPSGRKAIKKNHFLLKTAAKKERQDQISDQVIAESDSSFNRLLSGFKQLSQKSRNSRQLNKTDASNRYSSVFNQSLLKAQEGAQVEEEDAQSVSDASVYDVQLERRELRKMIEDKKQNLQQIVKEKMEIQKKKFIPTEYLRKLEALSWARTRQKDTQSSFTKYKSYTEARRENLNERQNQINRSITPQKINSPQYIHKIIEIAQLDRPQIQKNWSKIHNKLGMFQMIKTKSTSIKMFQQDNIDNKEGENNISKLQLNLQEDGISEECLSDRSLNPHNQMRPGVKALKNILTKEVSQIKNQEQKSEFLSPQLNSSLYNNMSFKNAVQSLKQTSDLNQKKNTITLDKSQISSKGKIKSLSSISTPKTPSIKQMSHFDFINQKALVPKNSPQEIIKGLDKIILELESGKRL